MSTENKLKPYLLSDFIQTEKEGKLEAERMKLSRPCAFFKIFGE